MSTHVEKVNKGGKKSLHTIKVTPKPTNSKKRGLRTMVASKDINKCCSGRKDTLFQKALELEVATSATVSLSVTRTNGSSFRYKSTNEIDAAVMTSVNVNETIVIDTEQPSTSNNTTTSVSSPRNQPRMRAEIATQTQESFLKEQLTVDPSSCRIRGEDKNDQRRLRVGCSFKNCNFWVHAMSRGIGSKTK